MKKKLCKKKMKKNKTNTYLIETEEKTQK